MLEPMTLDSEQEEAVQYMLRPESDGACLMGSEVGTGKTLVSLEFARRFGAKVVLIVAPMQTLGAPGEGGWHGTVEQQQLGLKFNKIDSTKDGQAALANFQWNVPGVYFVGHEMFVRMGWERIPVMEGRGELKRQKLNKKTGKPEFKKIPTMAWTSNIPDVVIFDEVHRTQNGNSITFKTLMRGQGNYPGVRARYKIGASGTPTGNSFDGAWAVTRWLWPHLIDASIYVWRARFCEIEYDPFAVRNQRVVGELVPGEFFNSLPCYVRIESDLDIEVDSKDIVVELYQEQRRIYNELDDLMVAWIKDNPLVVNFPITKRIRQRQATLGTPKLTYNKDGEVEVGFDLDCESAKVDSMWSILEQDFESEAALIFTDSQIFADVLVSRINKRYGGDSARKWSGKVSRKVRDQHKKDYLNGDFKYLVAVIRSSGTGTDGLQQVARNMLYVSSDDSRIDNEQSVGRLVRRGQKALVVRIRRLIAKDTIDTGQVSQHVADAIAMNKTLKRRAKYANR